MTVILCLACLLLSNTGAMSVSASTFIGGTTVFTLVDPPMFCANEHPNGCFQTPGMVYVNYRNNLNLSVLGIVFWVIHNSLGQTVGFGTATLQLAPGANETGYPAVYGLASGMYSSAVFAIATSGVAISNSTALAFNLTNQ